MLTAGSQFSKDFRVMPERPRPIARALLSVSDKTRGILTQLASQGNAVSTEAQAREKVANLFRLTAASPEFQRA